MNVCVQGLWHLGTVTSACISSLGHQVTGLEFEKASVEKLARGVPPVSEPGLEQLLRDAMDARHLRFTDDPHTALKDVELLWIAYDTPINDRDEADVDYVLEQIGRSLPDVPHGATVLISSQMPVGSVRRLEAIAERLHRARGLGFACSPENLRLGKAIEVFLNPDRIVAGVRSPRDKERLQRLFGPMADRILWMSVESAEMTKHAINGFLATSVTFANEIAAICESVGADAKDVEQGLKTESRIGPKAYLSPGAAFAGGTLARDVSFLKGASEKHQLSTPLLSAISRSNDEHKHWVERRLTALIPNLAGVEIGVWGIAYKPGTDTHRRSASVELCDWLLSRGASVRVHDPAVKVLPPAWEGKVVRTVKPLDAIQGARALVIATEWPEYKNIAADAIVKCAPGIAVLDPGRFLSHLRTFDVTYISVGTPIDAPHGDGSHS